MILKRYYLDPNAYKADTELLSESLKGAVHVETYKIPFDMASFGETVIILAFYPDKILDHDERPAEGESPEAMPLPPGVDYENR